MSISPAAGSPGSIHLNPRVQQLRSSATLSMNERCARLRQQGRKIYGLGFGQSPFPVPQSIVEALQAHACRKDYLPVKGLEPLRTAVAEFHRRRHGIPASGEDILIGPGSKVLLFLAQLAYEADLVIPSPSWVSYAPQAELIGRQVHWLPTRRVDQWRLRPEALETFCRVDAERPRMLVLNYPNNPTGLTYSEEDLARLAEVARTYKLIVLSDEIYGELHHDGTHATIAKYYPEGTIVSSGLSKWCGAGGWRLGTFCFPPALRWLLEAMACAASEIYTAASTPVQYAAVRAFQKDDEFDRYLAQSRRILRALGGLVSERLRAAGVDVAAPEGAFYLFPDFTAHQETLRARGIATSQDFCERLLEDTGVALLPGSDFGRPSEELTCRLAYVDFDGGQCLTAAAVTPELSERFLRQHCGNVVAATELIGTWLHRAA